VPEKFRMVIMAFNLAMKPNKGGSPPKDIKIRMIVILELLGRCKLDKLEVFRILYIFSI